MSKALIDDHLRELARLKADWGEGPWNEEPDREDFRVRGLPCFVQRNNLGAWCGYVGVPPGHPLHGKDYDEIDVDVHGGLTYAGACRGGICHVPETGEPDAVWWFGFDCAHAFDVTPGLRRSLRDAIPESPPWFPGEKYRTLAFVRMETERLAIRIASL